MQRSAVRLVGVFLITLSLAGCAQQSDEGAGPASDTQPVAPTGARALGWGGPIMMEGATFTESQIIDSGRAGGEPVIAITDEGTIIVSSHPGYTHYHPTPISPELVAASQTQSYLWRSTDGGESWSHVTLLPDDDLPNTGPRGMGQGVSDPELTIDGNGRIWLTDLEALGEASVSWSDDDGRTWLMGNNIASGGPIDRQWLASYGSTVYFTGNYFPTTVWPGGEPGLNDFIASEDGIVWETRGSTPCNGDVVAHPETGVLYQACGGQTGGFVMSTDGGVTWQRREAPIGCGLCEPAIDASGNVYMAGVRDDTVSLAFTQDDGETWSAMLNVSDYFPDLRDGDRAIMWPWTSAGSDGRVAVTFLAAPGASGSRDTTAKWFAYTVLITGATSEAPQVWPVQLTKDPLHHGAMCVGTVCQAKTPDNAANDRRMGDFFETTISPDGMLHVVYSNTAAYGGHSVSHVAFHKQVDGPSLVVGPVPDGFPTQG